MSDSLSPSSPSVFDTEAPLVGHEAAGERRGKHELIEAICQRNPGARPEFLSAFDEPTLASYLDRLTRLTDCRGRESVWVREGTTRAVVTRMPH